LNKIVKMSITIALIFAIASIGFASAAPRTLKQVNMLYSTSDNSDKWLPVAGNQVSDFKLKLDPSVEWYYLDIKFIKPDLIAGLTTFKLTPPTDSAFWSYWGARGVTAAAVSGTWQYVMWRIINGQYAMFGLTSDGNGHYMLVDALQKLTTPGFPDYPLRLNGDYPKGIYTFTYFAGTPNMGLEDVVMTMEIK
jgi:hypothetical protein